MCAHTHTCRFPCLQWTSWMSVSLFNFPQYTLVRLCVHLHSLHEHGSPRGPRRRSHPTPRSSPKHASNAVFELVVVVRRVRWVLLVEELRRLVRSDLRRGEVRAQVHDGVVARGGGRGLIQVTSVVAALRRLRRAVQTGRHQTVLVLSPRHLKRSSDTSSFWDEQTDPLDPWGGPLRTNLNELQVAEGPDVEVWRVLLRGDAAVELAVAAADRERLGPVSSAQGRRSVQPTEVRRRTKLCAHRHTAER